MRFIIKAKVSALHVACRVDTFTFKKKNVILNLLFTIPAFFSCLFRKNTYYFVNSTRIKSKGQYALTCALTAHV